MLLIKSMQEEALRRTTSPWQNLKGKVALEVAKRGQGPSPAGPVLSQPPTLCLGKGVLSFRSNFKICLFVCFSALQVKEKLEVKETAWNEGGCQRQLDVKRRMSWLWGLASASLVSVTARAGEPQLPCALLSQLKTKAMMFHLIQVLVPRVYYRPSTYMPWISKWLAGGRMDGYMDECRDWTGETRQAVSQLHQGLASHDLHSKCFWPPAFVNKVLLGHCHDHSHMYHLLSWYKAELKNCWRGDIAHKSKLFTE